MRYKLNDEITVYAQASKGFLIPTVSAYYVANPANGTIQPQETTNYQTGIVLKNAKYTFDADVYQITASNFPVADKTDPNNIVYYNGGTARYRGIEAEGSYSLINGLSAYGAVSLSQAKFIAGANNGLAVGNAPNYTLAGGLIFDNGTYFGSLMHKITGAQYGSSGQVLASATVNPGLNKVSAYNSTDFAAGVRGDVLEKLGFGKKATFKIGVNNIFDHRALGDIGGAPKTLTAADAKNALTYSFQSGRTFFGGLQIDF